MSEDKVTPEALVAAINAELDELAEMDAIARKSIAGLREGIAQREPRRAELRRMLPRAPRGPRKAKATD